MSPPSAAPSSASRCNVVVERSDVRTSCRSLLLLVPTYEGDFGITSRLFSSVLEHVTDLEALSVRFVLGNEPEAEQLLQLLSGRKDAERRLQTCPSSSSSLQLGAATLPAMMDHFGEGCAGTEVDNRTFNVCYQLSQEARAAAARSWRPAQRWKINYQLAKKLYGARYFLYETLLLLDSDSVFLGPTSIERIFANYAQSPLVMTSAYPRDVKVARSCLATLLNADDGETVFPNATPWRGMKGMSYYSMIEAVQNPKPLLHPLAPFVAPWGTQGWFWRRATVDALFEHVRRRHGVGVLERTMQISMISGEWPDADGAKPGYTPSQCFEPMLYWSFTLLPQSAGKTRNIKHGRQVVQVHGPESRFVPPSLMMERYFPNLHRDKLVTMSHFETSTWLLFIANTTEPFRGWLKMCLDFNLSFFRLPNPELANKLVILGRSPRHPLQPPDAHELLRWMHPTYGGTARLITTFGAQTKAATSASYGVINAPVVYGLNTYLAMVGCMMHLCPTLRVHANNGAFTDELVEGLRMAREDPRHCEHFLTGK